MPRKLPSSPSLRFLQKEAKDLLKAHKDGDPSCCPTLRYHFRFSRSVDDEILKADISLQEVQHALALDYGFKSWKDLKSAVESHLPADSTDNGNAKARKIFESIILAAVEDNATDVHFEPDGEKIRIRRRVDGVLYECDPLNEPLAGDVIAEGMRAAQLDLENLHFPQDGRYVLHTDDGRVDCRMSTVPGARGTVMAVRPIDIRKPVFELNRLASEGDQEERYRTLISQSHGIVIVTGPTGSGKTTTLYATLCELNEPSRKIVTIEDPVEYTFTGIDQIPVRKDFGFEAALRSVLRQAPNVIMAGEIRSLETVNLLAQAALTGHQVFTTLHADTAPGAYIRLLDMGMAPFLVKDTVRGVLGQRLVRRLCPECKEEYAPDETEIAQLGPAGAECKTLCRAVGCKSCKQRGYNGRIAVFSLLEMNDKIGEAILSKNSSAIENAAKASGWQSLREVAMRKVLRGETTLNEIAMFT